jgi:hypothetical protein
MRSRTGLTLENRGFSLLIPSLLRTSMMLSQSKSYQMTFMKSEFTSLMSVTSCNKAQSSTKKLS